MKYISFLSIFAFAWLATNFACQRKARPSGPSVGQPVNVLITRQADGYGPCEPSIAISPVNPDQVVAGTILDQYYYSTDGGKSWKGGRLESPYGVYGDPVVLADYAGNFFYAHLANPGGGGRDDDWLDRIVIQRSTDGGKSWNGGSYTGLRPPRDQDKHWLATDPRNGYLYVTWTEFDEYGSRGPDDHSRILFSRSLDSGESWSEAIPINQYEGNCLDGDQTTEGAVPAVGLQGEIVVAWGYDEKIYFDRSLNSGLSWRGEDIIVAEQPGGWDFSIPGIYRCNGMPVTDTDLSGGPYQGSIYVNWSDQRNGTDDTDIWISASRDGGLSWSAPVRVNDDGPGSHQFFSWMAVDPTTGYIYIVFYDRRNYEDKRTDVYLAYSTDGGETFTNQRISESPFTPTSSVFFGDYNDISAYDGKVRPIWTRLDEKGLSVWTALIEIR